ncbi:Uncharacterised protein [Candidatus Gugararchaeum adminiculabundum]|nr:Uncharacterised protein [Candidatus Gugararchaeum adminiculabundum]
MNEIEKAFKSTCAVLLGRPLKGETEKYERWLMRHVTGFTRNKSQMSDKKVYAIGLQFYQGMLPNLVTYEESLKIDRKLSPEESGSLTLKNAEKALSKICTTTTETVLYENIGSEECVCYGPTQYCYRGTHCWFSKYAGYCFWLKDTEYIFGASRAVECAFCINVYNSFRLTRCFETSDSGSSSDCYYCHNVENCENCMFCFNAKGLKYAIGNVEVGPESYAKFRKMLQEKLARDLEEEGTCRDVYELGTGGSAGAKKSGGGGKAKIGMVKRNG